MASQTIRSTWGFGVFFLFSHIQVKMHFLNSSKEMAPLSSRSIASKAVCKDPQKGTWAAMAMVDSNIKFCRFLRYRMIQEHRAVLSKPGTRSYSIVLGSSQAGQHGQTKSWWPPFQYNPICFWYDHLNNPPLINFQYARHEWHIHIHLKNFLTSSGSEEYHPRQTQRRESLVERALRICPQKTAGLGKVQVRSSCDQRTKGGPWIFPWKQSNDKVSKLKFEKWILAATAIINCRTLISVWVRSSLAWDS